jgi:hypothetical protein
MGQLEMAEKDKSLKARVEGESGVFSVNGGGWYS